MSALPAAHSPQQAALLIDADNFSDPQAIEGAWAELNAHAGRVSVCRAYGAAPRLEWLRSVWRYLGTRTFPNLPLEKNTTDAALIADAVALYFQQGVRIFAIASGDADFAPLAVRLREWGCEVWCFSMEGIVFRDAQAYYDRVKCFPAPVLAPAPAAPVLVKSAVPVGPAAPFVPVPVPAPRVPAIPVRPLAPVASASTTSSVMAAPCSEKFPAVPNPVSRMRSPLPLPDEVQHILKAIPGLREGPQHLSQVVCVLRQQGILGKTTKSTTFLARHAAYFELSPVGKPTQLLFHQPSASPTPKSVGLSAKSPLPVSFSSHEPRAIQPVIKRREVHALRAVLAAVSQLKVSVADILLAFPELLQRQPCAVAAVSARLRQNGLIRPSASGLGLLQRYPQSFRIRKGAPADAVQYLG